MFRQTLAAIAVTTCLPVVAIAQFTGNVNLAVDVSMTPMTVASLPAPNGTRGIAYVINDADCNPATVGGGIVLCLDTGTAWVPVGSGTSSGGGGSTPSGSITLDAGTAANPSLKWPSGGMYGVGTNGVGLSFLYNGTTYTSAFTVTNCTSNLPCFTGSAINAPQFLLAGSSPTSPNIRPDKGDTDTGMGKSTGGGISLTDENVSLLEAENGIVRINRVATLAPSTQVCADNGAATPGTLAIDASTSSLIYLNALDPDGCKALILSVGARPNAALETINVGAYPVTLTSESGVLEAAGTVVLGQYDAATFRRIADRWVQTGSSDNHIGIASSSFADSDLPDDSQPLTMFNAFGNVSRYPGGYIAVYRKGGSHIGDRGKIWGVTSPDGVAWGTEFLIYEHATYDSRDPEIMMTSGGDLYLNIVLIDRVAMDLITNANLVLKSATPTTPSGPGSWSIVPANSTFTGGEASSAPLVEMPNGDLLYPVWGRDIGDGHDSSRLLKSVDGGATWTEIAIIAGDANRHMHEPVVVRLDDGRLMALIRTGATHYVNYSTDSGVTWSTPVPAFSGGGAPRFIQMTNGALVVNYRSITDGSTVVRWSSNRGSTWSAEALIDRDFHHYGGFAERADAPNVALLVYWGRTAGTVSRGHATHIDLNGLGIAP